MPFFVIISLCVFLYLYSVSSGIQRANHCRYELHVVWTLYTCFCLYFPFTHNFQFCMPLTIIYLHSSEIFMLYSPLFTHIITIKINKLSTYYYDCSFLIFVVISTLCIQKIIWFSSIVCFFKLHLNSFSQKILPTIVQYDIHVQSFKFMYVYVCACLSKCMCKKSMVKAST